MMPKGNQNEPKREPKRPRNIKKGALRQSTDFGCQKLPAPPEHLLEPFWEPRVQPDGRHFSQTTLLDLAKCVFYLGFNRI